MASLKTDICIIGATLNGLITAQSLSSRGLNVIVVEKSDRVGGAYFPTTTAFGSLPKEFAYWPDSPSTELALNFVSHVLGRDLQIAKANLPPQTFHKGQFQAFVGFGENAPPYVDELSYYLSDARIIASESSSSILEELQQLYTGKIIFGASLNKIHLHEEVATSIELDDGRTIEASGFVFCEDARMLFNLLPTEDYTQREIQRVNRTPLWNTVSLDILHSAPVTAERNVFLLSGNSKDSLPCVGAFDSEIEFNNTQMQSSHWMTFVSTEHEDEELSAHALREIKRQVKRAFPMALDHVAFEKITLHPHSHGKLPLKSDAQGRWPGISNFWLGLAHTNPQANIIGSACQCFLVLESISAKFGHENLAIPVAHGHA